MKPGPFFMQKDDCLYQRAEMRMHHALEMLKHRTGLTKLRCIKLIATRYYIPASIITWGCTSWKPSQIILIAT